MMNVEANKKGGSVLKSTLRPLIMVGFVLIMVLLMQQYLEEKQELKKQQAEIDPSSVIYSDIGVSESVVGEEATQEFDDGSIETPTEPAPLNDVVEGGESD
jgi:hypothetical protein